MTGRTTGMPDGRPGFNGSTKYRLVARRRGDGWLITRGGAPAADGGSPGSAALRTSPALPSFSVRADGRFEGLILDEAAPSPVAGSAAVRAQLEAIGGCVLLDAGNALGARERGDVIALGEQPGKNDLCSGCTGLSGNGLDLGDDAQVALEIRLR